MKGQRVAQRRVDQVHCQKENASSSHQHSANVQISGVCKDQGENEPSVQDEAKKKLSVLSEAVAEFLTNFQLSCVQIRCLSPFPQKSNEDQRNKDQNSDEANSQCLKKRVTLNRSVKKPNKRKYGGGGSKKRKGQYQTLFPSTLTHWMYCNGVRTRVTKAIVTKRTNETK